jgi:hypothetical protein
MNSNISITPKQLFQYLLYVAPKRPVFVWGPPGIGKSEIIAQFAREMAMPLVSLLGTQLAPEDIMGVPQIHEGKTRFCPPGMIAQDEPYILFLDDVNGAGQDVQKAFYSLIHERRVGEYTMPEGSIVIGAGNRAQDAAIVRQMSSALLNRMLHVHLRVHVPDWLEWAYSAGIHPWVLEYVQIRPDHLAVLPPKTEEPFSTPRSWHMLSDALHAFDEQELTEEWIKVNAYGTLTSDHAMQFAAFIKQLRSKYDLARILKGEGSWPRRPEEYDVLYFLSQSFRAQILKELPGNGAERGAAHREFAHRAKALIKELAGISHEMAQMVVADTDGERLPSWFMMEVFRDLPNLVSSRDGA